MLTPAALCDQFNQLFGREPRIFSAPGRVNLIGEHTDYNDGFVLPMAIDRRTFVAAAARDDKRIRATSTIQSSPVEFEIGDEWPRGDERTQGWGDYVYGVAECLRREEFNLRGADLLITSEVPVGAGLSSSAALEISVGFALLKISEQPVDLLGLALTCQRAEQEFAGTQCGIMDQYIACLGIEGHALLIDCRSLEYRAVPIDTATARIVVCNSMVKHDLASGEYNRRRAECEEGVRRLAAHPNGHLSEIRALRDMGLDEFDLYADSLPEFIRRRSKHVITENARTLAAVEALESDNPGEFGRLMYASHESLRDDYEVSCRELDLLVEIASRRDGVFGARMTGGGFGGCTVNLVESGYIEQFITTISGKYERQTGINPECYVCQASSGVREEI